MHTCGTRVYSVLTHGIRRRRRLRRLCRDPLCHSQNNEDSNNCESILYQGTYISGAFDYKPCKATCPEVLEDADAPVWHYFRFRSLLSGTRTRPLGRTITTTLAQYSLFSCQALSHDALRHVIDGETWLCADAAQEFAQSYHT